MNLHRIWASDVPYQESSRGRSGTVGLLEGIEIWFFWTLEIPFALNDMKWADAFIGWEKRRRNEGKKRFAFQNCLCYVVRTIICSDCSFTSLHGCNWAVLLLHWWNFGKNVLHRWDICALLEVFSSIVIWNLDRKESFMLDFLKVFSLCLDGKKFG